MAIQMELMSAQTTAAVAQIEAECFSNPWSHDAFIAVKKVYRRQGVGKALLNAAIAYCRDNRLHLLMLEVRKSNLSAIALYEQFGFQAVGFRKRFYSDPEEDAILMNKILL